MTSKKVLLIVLALIISSSNAWGSRKLPVDGGTITSGIGWRPDPFGSGKMMYHRGIDIAVPEGTKVFPTRSGTILFAGNYRGYGNMVAVDHGGGSVTLYGHNAELLAKPGQRVTEKTVIALSGNTGRSTGPHLHYEERRVKENHKLTPEEVEEELMAVVRENVDSWVQEWIAQQGLNGSGQAAGATEGSLH